MGILCNAEASTTSLWSSAQLLKVMACLSLAMTSQIIHALLDFFMWCGLGRVLWKIHAGIAPMHYKSWVNIRPDAGRTTMLFFAKCQHKVVEVPFHLGLCYAVIQVLLFRITGSWFKYDRHRVFWQVLNTVEKKTNTFSVQFVGEM